MAEPPYAHTLEGRPSESWEPLYTPFGGHDDECRGLHCEKCERMESDHGHLNKVAWWTGRFAERMFPEGSEDANAARNWGYLTGLWHDLGKFAPVWQGYLAAKSDPHKGEITGKVDHSTAGAIWMKSGVSKLGLVFSYLIAGHHSGLANGLDGDAPMSSLAERLKKKVESYEDSVPEAVLSFRADGPPPKFALRSGPSLGFFQRMMFSCLTDADFLATEAFMNATVAKTRPVGVPGMGQIEETLGRYLLEFSRNSQPGKVGEKRAEILSHCLEAAEKKPGIFSLTVPTGGGKTLSSLAFALKHARIHGFRRVIYVIPFTSIIEQNADVFRKALAELGPDIVLEHHSNLDPDDESKCSSRSRLAAENWDARVVVTTNVQFFESLHANRTSRCRKIHRIARSVIVLDEAQTLPVGYMATCLRTLEELTTHYGSTVVLCTATQPVLHRSQEFKIGIEAPVEIIPDPQSLYRDLKRVVVKQLGKISDADLIAKLLEYPQSLCIVNTRKHARDLFKMLPQDGSNFHLSALLCPEHRSDILVKIKERLAENTPVRIISTQLIEAGVDIDLPVVFRSLAGLDSIAQAAGRCDREGKLTAAAGMAAGRLFLFIPENPLPAGFLRQASQSTTEVVAGKPDDVLGLECIESYFRIHYWKHQDQMDEHRILDCWPGLLKTEGDLLCFQFKKCAESFQLIDDNSGAVIVPYGPSGKALCEELRRTYDPARLRYLSRKLQRYTVTVPKAIHMKAVASGLIQMVHDQFPVLNSDVHYREEAPGLTLDLAADDLQKWML